ncbi:arylsulfatase B-like [Littorina saxatilis]|uniref:Sulfatase N-terminal domain-containing protein n=1 Tax=Littorina saxatilis TaxID=31220 RepID=A0AAN9B552_9CAEN
MEAHRGMVPRLVCCVVVILASATRANCKPPHIVFIVADDLGWNDVGWNNPKMATPNLNRLAKQGVILGSAYVQPICSPSRASFMTGYFPIRLGLQQKSIRPHSSKRIPRNITIIPEVLKSRGYATHMVGKWHLGFCNWKYTPTRRGFDSFFGNLFGSNDYYQHIANGEFFPEFKATSWLTSGPLSLIKSSLRMTSKVVIKGTDFRFNETVYREAIGHYATELFSERAVTVIERHDKAKPLFLYLAFKSPHGPLQVPKRYERRCKKIKSKSRRIYCGMVAALDEAVGNVTKALFRTGLTDNLLLVFTSDNGGAVYVGGNNLPLRGAKTSLWEGGTRVPAFVFSPTLLGKRGYKHSGLFHGVDWLPTFAHVAGASTDQIRSIDGINQWQMLTKGRLSQRSEFVYNLDNQEKNGAIRFGDWKLIAGRAGVFNKWYPVMGEHVHNTDFDKDNTTDDSTYMLFNIKADPSERFDQFSLEPTVAAAMVEKLDRWRGLMVPAQSADSHPRADPSLYDGVWTPGWC